MTCKHEWIDRSPRVEDNGTVKRITTYRGKQCRHCPRLRGGDQGPLQVEVEWREHTNESLPAAFQRFVIEPGLARLRAPPAIHLHDDARAWVEAGGSDGVFRHHRPTNTWRVVELRGPNVLPGTGLAGIRVRLASEVPEAKQWLATATGQELQTAEAILRVQDWRNRRWPGRVWNSMIHGDSKKGDAARIAERLGADVPKRGHGLWFYGTGTLVSGSRELDVAGECSVATSWFNQGIGVQAQSVGIVENRDLASVIQTNGLIFAIDGQPTPAQRAIIQAIRDARIPVWCWFDQDAAGVMMARRVKRLVDAEVRGFDAYPQEWGLPLTPARRLQARDAAKVKDEFTPVLQRILRLDTWWEQERIWAYVDLNSLITKGF